ncbi:aspartyl/asparaginyl beta-hydroxylase domain-containing protein [Sphingomonas jatrophae]|uniref:Aspartyl/Asparaginyl beta-hydroxylase n=1 Tax=Sphingomonas jatrophae TaxID=1166337 RepID=A0A1I6M6Y8_9SPHN|nr:aspartyl/asparaginyl beta-hydroxylase domain-containing protein [Sphingomonas jatrophae]SFS11466.1 Aspartyl/Asparaginyl beta-hydroxylase [Sphingomonas jatrophae]
MSDDFQTGVDALRRGDGASAREAFLAMEAAGASTHQSRLLLAQASAMTGDDGTANAALDRILAEEPGNLYALVMRGDLLMRAENPRAAVPWYQAALAHAPRFASLPPDLIETLRRAERVVAQVEQDFRAHVDAALSRDGIDPAKAGTRFAEALEILAGNAPVHVQQPTNFYYPRLPAIPFFARSAFDWVPALEAKAPAIREELQALLADEGALTPYVAAEADRPAKQHSLMGDPRWSAFHLLRGGEPVAGNAERCPVTMAALEALPLPRIPGRSPIALFSVLRAGTHIPPHHGLLNTRLICHLPLIVPNGCRLRVGNHARTVQQDRVLIFDDTIEHEAWNDGDATRVVLLFEIWRPDLTAEERAALTSLFGTISAYAPSTEDQAGA